MMPLDIIDIGKCDYDRTYDMQRRLLEARKRGDIRDTLIFVEHNNVITVGRTGSPDNILASSSLLLEYGLDVRRTDRGGDVTFHGDGQMVIYPIIDLRNFGRDVRRYLRSLESVIIELLAGYGIAADGPNGRTGVWTGGKKIAFIGVGVSGWVTYHGTSINMNVDRKFFSLIRPCGLEGLEVVSLSELCGGDIAYAELKEKAVAAFKGVFGYE